MTAPTREMIAEAIAEILFGKSLSEMRTEHEEYHPSWTQSDIYEAADAVLAMFALPQAPAVTNDAAELDWKAVAERAKDASEKVLRDAKVDPAQLQVPYSEAHRKYVEEHGWPPPQPAQAPAVTNDRLEQVLRFLDSIEGSGYGGMAEFEIARMTVRGLLGQPQSTQAPADWQPIETKPAFTLVEERGVYTDENGGGLFFFKATHWRPLKEGAK